jgi:secondary thiamine-phosphate synthase enzyme
MQAINVQSGKREELVDITGQVRELIRDNQWENGVLLLYCTHTTAGVTINEAADPSVVRDILVFLNRAVPKNGDYKHMEGNSDAHIKSSLIGCSEQLIVNEGKPVLGTWQGIFFAEFDGPRSRRILAQWTGD